MIERTAWEQYWMQEAQLIATRSTCAAGRRVGVVFVIDNRRVSAGFNGVPEKYPHPTECARRVAGVPSGQGLDLCVCAHAEVNGIINAARVGVALKGSDVFCTTKPCGGCMGALANTGVARVFFMEDYPSANTDAIALHAGIELIQVRVQE